MYGLIGKTLSHSFSPEIHRELASYDYELFELEEFQLKDFLNNYDFDGINVTIPYKKSVIPYLTEISPTAEKIGSVNTVIKRKDGSLYGDNTDYYGFMFTVKSNGIDVKNKKCLILGSGGASLSVAAVLKDLQAKEIVIISRTGENNYDNIASHSDAEIIVNTTPVGMYPDCYQSLISLKSFPRCEGVLELIYNPFKTKLLMEAEAMNIPFSNGLLMLVAQAKRSCELFTGTDIDESRIFEITNKLQRQLMNVVLIGMPGCGKTSTGKLLARHLNREFIDTDMLIQKKCRAKPKNIIEEKGEHFFRQLEEKAVLEVGCKNSSVIATGGGTILKENNINVLRQNGIIVFIDRNINSLDIKGRPLSANLNDLKLLYEQRMPIYNSCSDIKIKAESSIRENVKLILKELEL